MKSQDFGWKWFFFLNEIAFNNVQIHQVPAHLQNSWESYYMEILMVTGLLAYIMNYIIGKNKNNRLAQAWFSSHRELLESNFALVGELVYDLSLPPSPFFLWKQNCKVQEFLVQFKVLYVIMFFQEEGLENKKH